MNEEEILKMIDKTDVAEDPSSVDFLIDLLQHGEPLFREMAIDKLKKAKIPDVPSKIAKLFKSPNACVRNSATVIMAGLWDLSRDELTKLLQDEDREVRKLALDSLHYVTNDPSVVDMIAKVLDDSDINNQITAIEYIGELGGIKYKDKIEKIFLSSENEFLSTVCLRVLAEIGDKQSVEKIAKIFRDFDQIGDIILLSYMRLIARFPEVVDFDLLMRIARQKWKIALKEIIDVLSSILNISIKIDEDQRNNVSSFLRQLLVYDIPSTNKYEILILLSKLEQQKITKEIINYLYHPDQMVQIAAVEIIEHLHLKDYEDDLRKISSTTQNEDLKTVIDFVLGQLKGN